MLGGAAGLATVSGPGAAFFAGFLAAVVVAFFAGVVVAFFAGGVVAFFAGAVPAVPAVLAVSAENGRNWPKINFGQVRSMARASLRVVGLCLLRRCVRSPPSNQPSSVQHQLATSAAVIRHRGPQP